MKTNRLPQFAGLILSIVIPLHGQSLDPTVTSDFNFEPDNFSPSGGTSYWNLNPGWQSRFVGNINGVEVEEIHLVLDETGQAEFSPGRLIQTRVIEKRRREDGILTGVSRGHYTRALESGNIYFLGEDLRTLSEGILAPDARSWRSGINDARPGLAMPGSFLLGARYYVECAPGLALDRAVNAAASLERTVAAGIFSQCVSRIVTGFADETERNQTFAPGVGLIRDGDLELADFQTGALQRLPRGMTYSTVSDHPYFPFAPGQVSVFEGVEDGIAIRLTQSVLGEVVSMQLGEADGYQIVPARIIEEIKEHDGAVVETTRIHVVQVVETGDVHVLADVPGDDDGWVAGSDGAKVGLIMPGNPATGMRYSQEAIPSESQERGTVERQGTTVATPAGTYPNCLEISELDLLDPEAEKEYKIYAPGIGMICDNGELELVSHQPAPTTGLKIEPGMIISWSGAGRNVEMSDDLTNWVTLPEKGRLGAHGYSLSRPVSASRIFYRVKK